MRRLFGRLRGQHSWLRSHLVLSPSPDCLLPTSLVAGKGSQKVLSTTNVGGIGSAPQLTKEFLDIRSNGEKIKYLHFLVAVDTPLVWSYVLLGLK